MAVNKFNKKLFKEGKCPNCGSEDIAEITGWCWNHQSPELNGDDLPFCSDSEDCGYVEGIKNAFMCNDCDTMFDDKEMVDWNTNDCACCPVGERVPEETPEEYAQKLYTFITEYSQTKINDCIRDGYYLEAIGSLHIQLSEQLRFLLIKRIKGHENIPLSKKNNRYNEVVTWVKGLKDFQLYVVAHIFARIDDDEKGQLNALNTLRNNFSHTFEKRKDYSDTCIQNIIKDAQKIEIRLKQDIETMGALIY